MIKNVNAIMKIMVVSGITTVTPERSFSLARRIETWLRSTMTQRRFNALVILNYNKSLVDKLSLVKFASDFVDSLLNRRNDSGVFSEKDLKL